MKIPPRWKTLVYIVVLAVSGSCVLILSAERFLAVQHPVGKGVLVVEAWIPDPAIVDSARLFQSGRYSQIVVVGHDPDPDDGDRWNLHKVTLASETLQNAGIPLDRIVALEADSRRFGRTYANAVAVDRWLQSSHTETCCMDVVTIGVHARKSWVAFLHAFDKRYAVGIISVRERKYDAQSWRWSRRRVRIVARNICGYIVYKLWLGTSSAATAVAHPLSLAAVNAGQ